ncbi:FAD-dependent oxidoreductase [Tabrizicola sp. J26]|uniref:flavin monoamine oxidase family protein n=1 Tax=Alitabrizicola rongguiensis TaxID=2909234 RepID=UPI001F1B7995|nr:NAD(P)/FAD-dependent oxidoreductase [Tabrizicola rongguiensis]MCF1709080.1 FAD-dependent oxidoreductase [Tabrizicola rongguiensis]
MVDAIIIGGGLAGAASALWLADRGHSSVIVEARNHLGGRARSRPHPGSGEIVEYGGGWIRRDHDQIRALAKRLGLGFTPRVPIAGHHYFLDGQPVEGPAASSETAARAPGLLRFQGDAFEADRFSELALSDYFETRTIPEAARREILAWWTISGSGDPARISVSELLTPKVAAGLMIKLEELADTVTGGVEGLVRRAAEASGAEIRPGVSVTSVTDTGSGVVVGLADGTALSGTVVIVAAPINTLNGIAFSPALLPEAAMLCGTGHGGRAIKLLIRAWGVAPGLLATGETAGLRFLYADHVSPDGTTLIVAFGLQDEVGAPDLAQIAEAVVAAFPGAQVIDFDWHDWIADPFALGTWVSPYLENHVAYDPANWSDSPHVLFAGSDFASAEQGWFEGALLTAEMAVNAADRRLNAVKGLP